MTVVTKNTTPGLEHEDQEDEVVITPVNILIVEDMPEISELLSEDLKDVGFCSSAHISQSMTEATVMLEEIPDIDCILVDWSLPDGEGLELVKKLRQSEVHQNKAIVIISANDDINDILEAVRCGATDYIVKPWSRSELKDKIGYALRKHARSAV
jgi:DNA-binding response OmpR family regulator